jgi:hypothetical protein
VINKSGGTGEKNGSSVAAKCCVLVAVLNNVIEWFESICFQPKIQVLVKCEDVSNTSSGETKRPEVLKDEGSAVL